MRRCSCDVDVRVPTFARHRRVYCSDVVNLVVFETSWFGAAFSSSKAWTSFTQSFPDPNVFNVTCIPWTGMLFVLNAYVTKFIQTLLVTQQLKLWMPSLNIEHGNVLAS